MITTFLIHLILIIPPKGHSYRECNSDNFHLECEYIRLHPDKSWNTIKECNDFKKIISNNPNTVCLNVGHSE